MQTFQFINFDSLLQQEHIFSLLLVLFCVARRVLVSFMLLTPLIGPTPSLLLQDGAVLSDVPDSFALLVAAGVPHRLHGAMPGPDTGLELKRRQRLSTCIVHTMCRMSSSPKSRSCRSTCCRTRHEGLGRLLPRTSRRVLSISFPPGDHDFRPGRNLSHPSPGRAPCLC